MDFSVFAIFDETLCIFRMHDGFFHPPFLALCGAAPRSGYSSALKRAPARSSALPRAPAHSSELQRTCSSLSLPCPCAARSQARAFASGSAGALPSVAAISSVQAPCVDYRARRAISLANRGVVQRSLLRGSSSRQWVEAYTQMSRAVAAVRRTRPFRTYDFPIS